MFLDLDDLSVEQLLQKQIEIRQRMMQARGMSGQVMDQLHNMFDQVSIQLQTKVALDKVASDREKSESDGKNLDDNALNIG
jgi:hypothetical protein|tara:strand:- start:1813 stop:2055 length:243 start_codon:yes stop_codon:yes gene_type:complete